MRFCSNCDARRELDVHGRCGTCGSEAVYEFCYAPQPTIEDLAVSGREFAEAVMEIAIAR